MWFLRDKTNKRKSHRRPKQRILYNLNEKEFRNSILNIPQTDIFTSPSQPLALYSIGNTLPPKKAKQPVLETTAQEDYELETSTSPKQRNLAYTQALHPGGVLLEDTESSYRPTNADPLESFGMHEVTLDKEGYEVLLD